MRRKMWITAALLALALPLGGCRSQAEKVTAEMLDVMEEITHLLQRIQTTNDRDAAQAELDALHKRLHELQDRSKALEKDLSEDEKKQLEKEYKSRMAAAEKAMAAETLRVKRLTKPLKPAG